MVRIRISAQGRVVDARVSKSSGSRLLDRAALIAVRRWKFKPATQAGEPIAFDAAAPVVFKLTSS